jgi:hypothetical protein
MELVVKAVLKLFGVYLYAENRGSRADFFRKNDAGTGIEKQGNRLS